MDVPYAYVKKTNGGQTVVREYYIRTSHGKRYVSDRQLQFLFKQEELNFTYPFETSIDFWLKPFKLLLYAEHLPCLMEYFDFFMNLSEKDLHKIINDGIDNTILDLTPYILLCTFSYYFGNSWSIKLVRNNIIKSNNSIQKKKITYLDLPDPPKNSVFNDLSVNFKEVINKPYLFKGFFIPPYTKLCIDRGNLMIQNPDFTLNFSFHIMSEGSAVLDPYNVYAFHENASIFEDNFNDNTYNINLSGSFDAKFNFPEKNYELYFNYYQFAQTIKYLIEQRWDFEKYEKRVTNEALLESIDNKLDFILKLLNKK